MSISSLESSSPEKPANGAAELRRPECDLSIIVPVFNEEGNLATQFILFGLMCELIVRTCRESQGKPTYLLRRSPGRRATHPWERR